LRGVLRLRVGSYRVSYTIDETARVVDVWRVGHRSTFHKRLQGR
jgi:mRNA-degrading endonuclease RelE of RelBE toxin-antitoxin system